MSQSTPKPPKSNEAATFLPATSVDVLPLLEVDGHRIVAARARSDLSDNGLTHEHVSEDAFMLSIQLRDYSGLVWVDDGPRSELLQRAGHIKVYDYRRSWQGDLLSAFDCVNFHLPRSVLTNLMEDGSRGEFEDIGDEPGSSSEDPVVLGLTQALLPALSRPLETNALFVDHVGRALGLHAVRTYGKFEALRAPIPGTLARWQERRAKEMISANLIGNLSLAEIAMECGLSASHFARAFRRTTGLPPHQWLLHRRVAAAKALLLDQNNPIADVASACGFADQSHLGRVFTRLVGQSPGAWRRGAV